MCRSSRSREWLSMRLGSLAFLFLLLLGGGGVPKQVDAIITVQEEEFLRVRYNENRQLMNAHTALYMDVLFHYFGFKFTITNSLWPEILLDLGLLPDLYIVEGRVNHAQLQADFDRWRGDHILLVDVFNRQVIDIEPAVERMIRDRMKIINRPEVVITHAALGRYVMASIDSRANSVRQRVGPPQRLNRRQIESRQECLAMFDQLVFADFREQLNRQEAEPDEQEVVIVQDPNVQHVQQYPQPQVYYYVQGLNVDGRQQQGTLNLNVASLNMPAIINPQAADQVEQNDDFDPAQYLVNIMEPSTVGPNAAVANVQPVHDEQDPTEEEMDQFLMQLLGVTQAPEIVHVSTAAAGVPYGQLDNVQPVHGGQDPSVDDQFLMPMLANPIEAVSYAPESLYASTRDVRHGQWNNPQEEVQDEATTEDGDEFSDILSSDLAQQFRNSRKRGPSDEDDDGVFKKQKNSEL